MASLAFAELAGVSAALAATPSKLEKVRLLVSLLRQLEPGEVAHAVGWLVGQPPSGPLGVGPAQLWRLSRMAAKEVPTLLLAEVDRVLGEAATVGRGAALQRVTEIFDRLTEAERGFFVGALTGTLRQGSLGGVMQSALSEVAGLDLAVVRRAVLVRGGVVDAARDLLGPRRGAPPETLEIGRPLAPMLASQAEDVAVALAAVGAASLEGAPAAVEWKIDGVRAQIHKEGERVVVFSRQGNDITEGCAPLLPGLRELQASACVLDGEVILVGADGRPRPFQDSFSAVASKSLAGAAEGDRLRVHLFDCLHRDGVDLLDAPLSGRLTALAAIAAPDRRVPQIQTRDPEEARAFYEAALAAGQEGVMVKDLSAPYQLGARGKAWQKVKPFVAADLVVLAVEWGSGRRKGRLSNLHLGARRDEGTFCMVGKTFKGLTDAMLVWQTERLLALETSRDEHVVHVRPELVVEVRFGEVQRSPRYPGGVALRFARVVRHREDKRAEEADTLAALVARVKGGFPARGTAKRGTETPARRQLTLFAD